MRGLFQTRDEVERYFGEDKIKCLLCGQRFLRLSFHLAAKHSITTDEYKSRFGLPWTRGLTSAQSHANSGWDGKRKLKASKLANQTKFFRFSKSVRPRPAPLFLQAETAMNLRTQSVGYDKQFDATVRALFKLGLTDFAISRALNVNRMTVNRRTKKWRKSKDKRRAARTVGRAGRTVMQSSARV